MNRSSRHILSLSLVVCAVGCQAMQAPTTQPAVEPAPIERALPPAPSAGGIPAGEWVGTGTFFEYTTGPGRVDDGRSSRSYQGRPYETRLSITRQQREGRTVIRIEIVSQSGRMIVREADRTSLEMELTPIRWPGSDVTYYVNADVGGQGRPAALAGPLTRFDRDALPMGVCYARGGITTLLLTYGVPTAEDAGTFVDVIRFEGDRAEKSGFLMKTAPAAAPPAPEQESSSPQAADAPAPQAGTVDLTQCYWTESLERRQASPTN